MEKECENRVLGSPEARVVQTKEIHMDHPLLLCCFPTAGVVGTIVANTIVEQLGMEEVAHVRSKFLPSAAIFLDGRLRHPFRVYGDSSKKILLVTTELPIAEEGLYPVSSALLDWAAQVGVKETVVLDGIPVQGMPPERKVLFVAEEEKIPELLKYEELELLNRGIITGIAGSILSETLCRSIVGYALLTPAIAMIPDPEGAIHLIRVLNKIYGLNIDVSELEETAEQIRKKMEEMAQQVHGMRSRTPASGPVYEGMYA